MTPIGSDVYEVKLARGDIRNLWSRKTIYLKHLGTQGSGVQKAARFVELNDPRAFEDEPEHHFGWHYYASLDEFGQRVEIEVDSTRDAHGTRNGAAVAIRASEKVFAGVSLILPPSIDNEELGDALEVIHERAVKGEPAWHLYLVMVSAIFWAFYNAIRFGWSRGERKRVGRD